MRHYDCCITTEMGGIIYHEFDCSSPMKKIHIFINNELPKPPPPPDRIQPVKKSV